MLMLCFCSRRVNGWERRTVSFSAGVLSGDAVWQPSSIITVLIDLLHISATCTVDMERQETLSLRWIMLSCMHVDSDLESEKVMCRVEHCNCTDACLQDIRNQRLYRHRRKQDMLRLKRTLKGLAMKRSFYEEQINYYSQYVKTCLDNLAAKRWRRLLTYLLTYLLAALVVHSRLGLAHWD